MGGCCVDKSGKIPHIGVNLLGEPGGIAFFENCRVKGMTTDEIVEQVKDCANKNEISILYDHPYYAGIVETYTIRRIITELQEMGVEIVAIKELI